MRWERLHPLSPVVRAQRAALPLLVLLGATAAHAQNGSSASLLVDLILLLVVALGGLVSWLVTRWAFDGAVLRIETGLIRRDARQLPVTRIQAVDVLRPFLARVFGLAELRIRLAGASAGGRLAYLSEHRALALQAALLAAHRGAQPPVAEVPEHALAIVPTPRLVGSVLLTGATAATVAIAVALGVLARFSPAAAAATGGFGAVYVIGLLVGVWRRFGDQYGFSVASAPDGLRIRRGLIGTVSETIPVGRVQAVRQIEPLLWRLLGWCRLEVDLAGLPHAGRGGGSRRVTKALLPVGPRAAAATLRSLVIGSSEPALQPPPRRAWAKAPLSYHNLAAGHDAFVAVAVTGRLRRVTCWVPLEKAQSVRLVQGPLQRALGLATVHLDVAGKRIGARFADRDAGAAQRLVESLAALTRSARRRTLEPAAGRAVALPGGGGSGAGVALAPAGWFADPSGRHRSRFWDGGRWTEHVEDDGVGGRDPP